MWRKEPILSPSLSFLSSSMLCTELLDIFHLHWWVFFVCFIKASKSRAGIVYTINNLLSRSRIDNKIVFLSLILLSVVHFQLLVALTILDVFEF